MDLGISEQQEMLLYKACKDYRGRIPVDLARSMYSSKSSAHGAIDKLELAGYIEHVTPGVWKVVKVTSDVKEELEAGGVTGSGQGKESSTNNSSSGSDSGSGSKWVAQKVS